MRPTGVRWLLYLGSSGGTNAYARSGLVAEARNWLAEMKAHAPPGDDERPSGRTAVTTAGVLLAEGEEKAAAAGIADAFKHERIDRGADRRMWRQNIDLSYVLVPETRPDWDAAPLTGHLLVTRRLAEAVVDDSDWLDLDREHYRTRFVRAAVRSGQLPLARGDADRAQATAHRALDADPWSEDAYAVLVSSALTSGDRSAAGRILRRCLEVLADMGVDPSPTTQQLQRRVAGTD